MNRYDILLGKTLLGKPYLEATQTLTIEDLEKLHKSIDNRIIPAWLDPSIGSIMPLKMPLIEIDPKRRDRKLNSWTNIPITAMVPTNDFLITDTTA